LRRGAAHDHYLAAVQTAMEEREPRSTTTPAAKRSRTRASGTVEPKSAQGDGMPPGRMTMPSKADSGPEGAA